MWKTKNTETTEEVDESVTAGQDASTLSDQQILCLSAVEKWWREERRINPDAKVFVEPKHKENIEVLIDTGYLVRVDKDHVRLSDQARDDFENTGSIF